MRVDLFDFDLPEERIALRPAEPRDSARLLVVRPVEGLQDRVVSELPALLREGDVLVFNDTKVIPAQLNGIRKRGEAQAQVEATLHMRVAPDRWQAFMRPGKRIAAGDRIHFGHDGNSCFLGQLDATVIEKGEAGEALLGFDLSGPFLDEALHTVGHIPLPPYIRKLRAVSTEDDADYQTIFAVREGAVAAPTAGLHFTPELLAALQTRGVEQARVTLHVGAGTFLPVKVDDIGAHKMHSEWGEVSVATAEAFNRARAEGRRIVAVGTTSLRLLESALDASGKLQPFARETDIFIHPGKTVRAADLLLTNFHLPKSTLFMLVCAFAGTEKMRAAYRHAIASGYRFFSYGDACLLENAA